MINKNFNMRKFYRIVNLIIIFDEVQVINLEYWFLCKNFFEKMCLSLNCFIIFLIVIMLFIVDKKIVVEIVKLEKYFDKFC